MSHHSEGIAGVRVKRFLALGLMELAKELHDRLGDKSDLLIEKFVINSIRTSFMVSSNEKAVSQITFFLASLGLQPVDIDLNEELRVGRIYLGPSRIWKPAESSSHLVNLLLKSITKGLGESLIGTNVDSRPLEEDLPPKFEYLFEIRSTEDIFAASTEEDTSIKLSANKLLEPILGNKLDEGIVSNFLIEASREFVSKEMPNILEHEEIKKFPLKILELCYITSLDNTRIDLNGKIIGKILGEKVLSYYPELKPNDFIQGLGMLPLDQIDELLFYAKHDMITTDDDMHKKEFSRFIASLWAGFATQILQVDFVADEPMFGNSKSISSIFTLTKSG